MTAEKYLEQIKSIDAIVINKLKDHRRFVELATGIGGFSDGERVKSSPNLQRGADAIGEYIDLEREIVELRRKREAIIKTLEQLPPVEYKILYMLYVEYTKDGDDYTFKELAYKFKKSYEYIKTRKRRGLRLVQNIIDKKEG
jgi:DNA-directed RNA polymerase specialized sigma24 family protein